LVEFVVIASKDIFTLFALSACDYDMNLTITVITTLTSEDKNLEFGGVYSSHLLFI